MKVARPYQLECIEALWGELFQLSTALCQLPTGAGKTFIISHFMTKAMEKMPGIRIAMMMGRVQLVEQTERALAEVIPRRQIGVFCGSLNRREISRPITVASVQSISEIDFPHLNLLVVDEVHNLDQDKGRYSRFIEKAIEKNSKLKIIGVTATPFRASGKIYGSDKLFKRICYKKTIKEMIAMGFLAPPILRSTQQEFDISRLRTRAGEYVQEDVDALVKDDELVKLQVADALSRIGDRQSVVWACANIDHCNRVADVLMSLGERVTTVHSKLSTGARQANLSGFMTGAMKYMSFVTVLSEGFDHPPIDAVILMRPTRSPVLYVQTVGRGLRISEGKKDLLVLDYGQVIKTLGALDDPHVPEKGESSGLKCCPQCMTYAPYGTEVCPICQYLWPQMERQFEAPEKKLDKKAAGDVKILSDKPAPTKETLGPAVIAMHEAKSGNLCVRITYEDRNYLNRWGGYNGTSEYFVVKSTWAMQRLERRLEDIGASIPKIPFDVDVNVPGTFEILKTQDGKYDRVLAVKKLSEENPAKKKFIAGVGFGDEEDDDPKPNSPEDLGFKRTSEEEGDSSFDFGANVFL